MRSAKESPIINFPRKKGESRDGNFILIRSKKDIKLPDSHLLHSLNYQDSLIFLIRLSSFGRPEVQKH